MSEHITFLYIGFKMLSSSLNDYVNASRDGSAVNDGSGANINIDYTTTKKSNPWGKPQG